MIIPRIFRIFIFNNSLPFYMNSVYFCLSGHTLGYNPGAPEADHVRVRNSLQGTCNNSSFTIGIICTSVFSQQILKQPRGFFPLFSQCDSSYIIGFYGAFFVENRISLCTEFMDGE